MTNRHFGTFQNDESHFGHVQIGESHFGDVPKWGRDDLGTPQNGPGTQEPVIT